jgi:uncharacterized protein YqeY
MLREAFADRLKQAMRAKDSRTVSAVRLMIAAVKDRDVAARGATGQARGLTAHGNTDGIADPEIQRVLQGMVKQRRESIALYRQGNRPELAEREEAEIAVIESFLPQQMSDEETADAARAAIADTGAAGVKDMGRVMAALRERHAGVIDLARAGAVVKQLLGQ